MILYEILKGYPDIGISLDNSSSKHTILTLRKTAKDGRTARIKIYLTENELNFPSEMIENLIEGAIQKLREDIVSEEEVNNPSSRGFQ